MICIYWFCETNTYFLEYSTAYKAQQQGKKDKKKKDQENATADKTASPTTDPAGGVANDSDDDVIMTPGQNGATDNGHDSEIEFVNGGE